MKIRIYILATVCLLMVFSSKVYGQSCPNIYFCKNIVLPIVSNSSAEPSNNLGSKANMMIPPYDPCYTFCTNDPNKSLIASPEFIGYDWYINGSPQMEISNIIQVTQSGWYRVDGFIKMPSGIICSSTFERYITLSPPPPKPVLTSSVFNCNPGSILLGTSTSGSFNYYWYNQNGTIVSGNSSYIATQPGNYRLQIRGSNNGCYSEFSDWINIVIPTPPTKPPITIYGNTTFCQGGSVDLEGPAGFKSYTWSNGSTSRRITVTTAGSYTLKVTDYNDCMSPFSDPVQVTIASSPGLSVVLDKNNLRSYSFLKLTIGSYNATNTYSINWGDGDLTLADNASEEHVYTLAGTYSITVEATNSTGCKTVATKNVTVYTPMCATIVPSKSKGEFKLNKKTGQIVFVRNDNCPSTIKIGCISTVHQADILQNVVAASATTFSDVWNYDVSAYNKYGSSQSSAANDFERGKLGKWRPKSIYTFKTNLNDKTLNYEAGTFDLEIFSWKSDLSNNPKTWLKTNTIEKYSPHGEPLQERNILGIASAAKFGYFDALPYLTIQNAEAEAAFFESFENSYGTAVEDGFVPTGGEIFAGGAHSGKKSYKLTGSKIFKLPSFKVKPYKSKGMLIKFWVKVSGFDNQKNLANLLKINSQEIPALQQIKVVAQTGEWILCQKYITDFGSLTDVQNYTPALNYSGTGDIWIDDIRLQPADAQMTAYVYDARSLKLLTVFDDQHFGLYYQYNAEGKLVRKQVETEKGAKTIQETQYNIPKNVDPMSLN